MLENNTQNTFENRKIDVKQLSLSECESLLKELPKRIAQLQKERDSSLVKQIEKFIANSGIANANDFLKNYFNPKSKIAQPTKRKIKAKYVNPENFEETWTGLGWKPRWLAQKIAADNRPQEAVLEDLLCEKNSAYLEYIKNKNNA